MTCNILDLKATTDDVIIYVLYLLYTKTYGAILVNVERLGLLT